MITQKQVRQSLTYNPDTGSIVWKERPVEHFKSVGAMRSMNSRYAGKPFGSVQTSRGKRYFSAMLFSKNVKVHRVIWLYMTGSWPVNQVDHINGDGTDNRWCNLREVDLSENGKNMRLREDNSTGLTGVYWCVTESMWRAQIQSKGKRITLGRFKDFFEAVCTRKSAENLYNFHKNHGSVRPL